MNGVILKGIAGFYYVYSEGKVYECKARGKFRNKKLIPLVGDKVLLSEDCYSKASKDNMLAGAINEILPRLNEFDRPPVANVENCIIVSAAKDPEPLSYIIDRMAVSAELKNSKICLCINKADLDIDKAEELVNTYKDIYPCFIVSTKTGLGIDKLKEFLLGKQSALCGASGVGKSSLANAILGSSEISQIGEISEKTLRGKNTTRHSELFHGDGFFLFDTPGFTSFEAPDLDENALDLYFPEFENYLGKCRFDNCNHINEPQCSIKDAVQQGKISKDRYKSYIDLFKEIKERRKY